MCRISTVLSLDLFNVLTGSCVNRLKPDLETLRLDYEKEKFIIILTYKITNKTKQRDLTSRGVPFSINEKYCDYVVLSQTVDHLRVI